MSGDVFDMLRSFYSDEGQAELRALIDEGKELLPVVEAYCARVYEARRLLHGDVDAPWPVSEILSEDQVMGTDLTRVVWRLNAAFDYANEGRSEWATPPFVDGGRARREEEAMEATLNRPEWIKDGEVAQ
jgi:hypothetical protein